MRVIPYLDENSHAVEIQISHDRSIFLPEDDARTLAKDILRLLRKPPFRKSIFSFLERQQSITTDPVVKSLSVEEISCLDDQNQIFLLIHDLINKKIGKSQYESLTRVEQTIDNIYWLEAEVNNGGFHQFFQNSAGNHTQDTLDSLELLGISHTKDLLLKACSVFPNSKIPSIWGERQNIMRTFSEKENNKLNTLDGNFLEYKDNLTEIIVKYIKQHKDQIIL